MTRIDQWAPVAIGLNQQIYLGTELQFTAKDQHFATPGCRDWRAGVGV
jgi:hypothetical protein